MVNETPKKERKFSQVQFDILMRCSEAKDVAEWNRWRAANPREKIQLEEAPLNDAYLKEAGLAGAYLKNAVLVNACLEGALLREADLTGAVLEEANLKGAKLWRARLQSTRLHGANLKKAVLHEADCQGTWINQAKLQGAQFNLVRVDGLTSITECEFDERTDFTGVGLDAATIDPGLKAALKNNIRRIHWQKWVWDAPTRGQR